MDLIAHRGYAAVNPENTLAAVRAAATHADVIEIDVRRCGSGELVVIHDETVDRVTDATGPVAEFTTDELAAMDVLETGEGIPTLAAVATAVPADVGLNVELKEPDIAADALTTLTDGGPDLLVSSFLPAALRRCRAVDPSIARALLFHEEPISNLELAGELGCTAVHPHLSLAEPVVDAAHDAGLAVNAWTVEDRGEAVALGEVGVDGIIADDPAVLDPE